MAASTESLGLRQEIIHGLQNDPRFYQDPDLKEASRLLGAKHKTGMVFDSFKVTGAVVNTASTAISTAGMIFPPLEPFAVVGFGSGMVLQAIPKTFAKAVHSYRDESDSKHVKIVNHILASALRDPYLASEFAGDYLGTEITGDIDLDRAALLSAMNQDHRSSHSFKGSLLPEEEKHLHYPQWPEKS